jgi:hypothetical protein
LSVVAFIQRCLANGMPLDTALEAAKAFEAEHPAGLSAGALRTRRWREKRAAETVTERHQASPRDAEEDRHQASPSVTNRHAVTPLARVELKPLTTVASGKIDDDDLGARRDQNDWPEGDARSHAAALVELCGTSNLDPARSPTLVTSMGRLAQWRRDGASWTFDVVPTITTIVQRVRKPIGTWSYFDRSIAQSIADNRAALAIPEASNVAAFPSRGQGPPSYVEESLAVKAAARRLALADESP